MAEWLLLVMMDMIIQEKAVQKYLFIHVMKMLQVGWLIYSSQPKGEILPHETVITVISEAKHKEDSEAKEVNRTQLHLLNTKSR